jgi:hypothetical protein
MRQLITPDDIRGIIGSWVIQLDKPDTNVDITVSNNPNFWLEKRISFVSVIGQSVLFKQIKAISPESALKVENLISLNGIYYCHGLFTYTEFVEYFNDCLPLYNKPTDGRFLRLLTEKELTWLNTKLQVKRRFC